MKKATILFLFGFALCGTASALELTDKVDVTGEVRARDELRMNYDFDSDVEGDDHFATLRSTLGFTFRPFEQLDVVVKARDWRQFGAQGVGGYGDDGQFHLYESYFTAKFSDAKFQMKIGRQEVALGSQRIFSNYENYKGLYHDGLLMSYVSDPHAFHFFTYKFHEASNVSAGYNSGVDYNDDYAFGFWYTWTRNENAALHAYLFSAKLNSLAGLDPTIYTLGVSYDDNSHDLLFWGVEGILQFGQYNDAAETDISAMAAHANVGVKLGDGGAHKLWIDLDYASGNDDDAEGSEEFTNFFGKNELSLSNHVAFRNVLHAGLNYKGLFAEEKLALMGGIHMFQLASEYGNLYSEDLLTGMFTSAGAANGEDTNLGMEISAGVKYTWNEYLSLCAAIGTFMPGDYPTDDSDALTFATIGGTAKF